MNKSDISDQSTSKPILVTGSHHSGTTWVGRMLAASPTVGYIHEPFNLRPSPGVCGASFSYWFTYVTDENENQYLDYLEKTLSFSLNLRTGIQQVHSFRNAVKLLQNTYYFSAYRSQSARPLVKDPLAVLSTEWLASRFNMEVVVMIRHPAAFVSSVKKRGWLHPYEHFLAQPLLMRDHLHVFEEEIRAETNSPSDTVANAALLWRLIYHVVHKFQQNHKDWLFVRHEDISRDPISEFQLLYEQLGVVFSSNEREYIRAFSTGPDSSTRSRIQSRPMRDSRSNIWSWKDRLTPAEVDRIRKLTEDVASIYYSDSDWGS